MSMKRLFILLVSGIILLFLFACASSGESASSGKSSINGKVIVVYFTHEGNNVFDGDLTDVDAITSASVQRDEHNFPPQVIGGEHKGNTQIIAEYIAEHLGADTFAIQVTDENKYPIDGYDTLDVGHQEQIDGKRPELATHIENPDDYDIIFLGSPIWWGTMPTPVFSFLEEYDFSGKTIVPFTTHDGSGLGSVKRDIKSECPRAIVLDGLAVKYSQLQSAKGAVTKWLDSLFTQYIMNTFFRQQKQRHFTCGWGAFYAGQIDLCVIE